MTSPAEPRTKKGWSTRQRVVDGAREVFSRQGYSAARVLDITEAAGVSLGGFYRYFRNKDDVFESILHDVDEEMYGATHVERVPGVRLATDPQRTIFLANRGYLATYREHADFLRSIREACSVDRRYLEVTLLARRRFRDRFIRRFQASGYSRDGTGDDNELVLHVDALVHMTEESAYMWFGQGQRNTYVPTPDLDTLAGVITNVWCRTLFPASITVPSGAAGE